MPLPVDSNPIERPSMRDEVYNHLLNWIVTGVLQPGEKIVDKELAGHMGVSRTPVREALRRLADKELVESSANRWTRVSKIPGGEPEMIYPIIWTLEKLAAADAIRYLTADDFKGMEVANDRLASALEAQDPVAASMADADFHRIFIERSQNTHLVRMIADLKIRHRRLEVAFFRRSCHDSSSLEEHRRLMSALAAGNLAAAEKAIHVNWEKSLARLTAQRRTADD